MYKLFCKRMAAVIAALCVLIGAVPPLPVYAEDPPEYVLFGDVNNDGVVDGYDVVLIRQWDAFFWLGGEWASGWLRGPGADVNNDGFVNFIDVLLLRQWAGGFGLAGDVGQLPAPGPGVLTDWNDTVGTMISPQVPFEPDQPPATAPIFGHGVEMEMRATARPGGYFEISTVVLENPGVYGINHILRYSADTVRPVRINGEETGVGGIDAPQIGSNFSMMNPSQHVWDVWHGQVMLPMFFSGFSVTTNTGTLAAVAFETDAGFTGSVTFELESPSTTPVAPLTLEFVDGVLQGHEPVAPDVTNLTLSYVPSINAGQHAAVTATISPVGANYGRTIEFEVAGTPAAALASYTVAGTSVGVTSGTSGSIAVRARVMENGTQVFPAEGWVTRNIIVNRAPDANFAMHYTAGVSPCGRLQVETVVTENPGVTAIQSALWRDVPDVLQLHSINGRMQGEVEITAPGFGSGFSFLIPPGAWVPQSLVVNMPFDGFSSTTAVGVLASILFDVADSSYTGTVNLSLTGPGTWAQNPPQLITIMGADWLYDWIPNPPPIPLTFENGRITNLDTSFGFADAGMDGSLALDPFVAGVWHSVSIPVETTGLANGIFSLTPNNLPGGVTLREDTVTIANGAGTLALDIAATALPGTFGNISFTIETAITSDTTGMLTLAIEEDTTVEIERLDWSGPSHVHSGQIAVVGAAIAPAEAVTSWRYVEFMVDGTANYIADGNTVSITATLPGEIVVLARVMQGDRQLYPASGWDSRIVTVLPPDGQLPGNGNVLFGDANGDGLVNVLDLTTLRRYLAGVINELGPQEENAAG